MARRTDVSPILLLFAAAVMARVSLITSSGFNGLYGQDAYAYYDFARAVVEGQLPGAFFWPLGYPAVLIATFTAFGVEPAAGQFVNVVFGSLLAPLIYVLARQMRLSPIAAFFAGLIMALCGQAVQSSVVLMADVPALFWTVFSAVLLWHYRQRQTTGWLAGAAFTLALAGITRWLYLALALPWAGVWHWRIRWRDGLLAVGAALLVLLPQAIYSRSSPFPALNHAWVEGWSVQNFSRSEFRNIDGHFVYENPNALFYAQPFYEPFYLSSILLPLTFIGLGVLLWWRRWAEVTFFTVWIALIYLFLAGIPYQNSRFPLAMFPAVALLTAGGVDALLRIRLNWRIVRWISRLCVFGWVMVGLLQMGQVGQAQTAAFIAHQQQDKAVAAWAAAQIPPDAHIYTFGVTLTMQHETVLSIHEIYYETPQTLIERWQPGRADYLLVNTWVINNQWAGREPQIVYHWLRDERGLVELGRLHNYRLFRIEG